MYSLPRPQRSPLADFDNIVRRRREPARTALRGARGAVANAYGNYRALSGDGKSIGPLALANPLNQYLRNNFRLLYRGQNQVIRDEILASARFGRCVYCSSGAADTLDHVLPRDSYAEFSVLAENLVPVCATCNRRKGESCYVYDGRSVPHPYFTPLPTVPILFAEVFVDPDEVYSKFYLKPHSGMDMNVFDSIQTLFELVGLNNLYCDMSAGEISERVGNLETQYEIGGAAQVREFLQSDADSIRRSEGSNYWRTVIVQALAESHDFCDGGFKLLLPRI